MHENEIVVLLLGSTVLIFIGMYRQHLQRLRANILLFAAYLSAWGGWFATVLEHMAWPTFFNVMEHGCYAANGLLLLSWCFYGVRATGLKVHD